MKEHKITPDDVSVQPLQSGQKSVPFAVVDGRLYVPAVDGWVTGVYAAVRSRKGKTEVVVNESRSGLWSMISDSPAEISERILGKDPG